MKVINGKEKHSNRIECARCGQSVFVEIIVNPRLDSKGQWDKRTGVRRLKCVNPKCNKIG